MHNNITGNVACDNFGFGGNCTADCGAMNSTDRISPPIDVPTIALATSVPILVVLLGLVTVCWIGTYRTMKKKIRALQSTLTSVNTGNR